MAFEEARGYILHPSHTSRITNSQFRKKHYYYYYYYYYYYLDTEVASTDVQ